MCFVTMCQGPYGILKYRGLRSEFMADFLEWIRRQLELEFPNILDRGWGPKYELAGITTK